eukprot:10225533-Prorocentrum_lima.AAC.1
MAQKIVAHYTDNPRLEAAAAAASKAGGKKRRTNRYQMKNAAEILQRLVQHIFDEAVQTRGEPASST